MSITGPQRTITLGERVCALGLLRQAGTTLYLSQTALVTLENNRVSVHRHKCFASVVV